MTNAEARAEAKFRLLAERGELTRRLEQVDRMLNSLDDTQTLADGVDQVNEKAADQARKDAAAAEARVKR